MKKLHSLFTTVIKSSSGIRQVANRFNSKRNEPKVLEELDTNEKLLDKFAEALQVEELAIRFAYYVREAITPYELSLVIEANKGHSEGSCATHDFVDANEVMLQALKSMGVDETPADANCSPKAIKLWNDAWDLAKSRDFLPFD